MLYLLLAVVLVAADQIVKVLVRMNIPLGGSVPFLPGIMDLTYLQNTGAAFSLFEEHTWILTGISAASSAVLLVALLARKGFRHPVGRGILALLLAGAAGNLIDRVAFGYVTDMFRTLFMDFAVFNVADACLTIGCIALAVYAIFFYDRLEKPRKEAEG